MRRAVVLALVLPCLSAAHASAAHSTYLNLHFRGSGGERFDITPFRHHLFLLISRRHDEIQYFARGFANRTRIKGTFGRFGSIDVRFKPQGDPRFEPAPEPCSGGTDVQRGVFTGSIEYLGDSGYAPVSRTRAPGLSAVGHVDCRLEEPPDPDSFRPSPRANLLDAWTGPDRSTATTTFEAVQIDGKAHASFYAGIAAREPAVTIYRAVFRAAPSDRFEFNLRRHRAHVEPPPPFTGQGSLAVTDEGRAWTGTLAATFPGLGAVPLAGPDFTARLWRATVLVIIRRAARELRGVARQLARYAGKYAPGSRPLLRPR